MELEHVSLPKYWLQFYEKKIYDYNRVCGSSSAIARLSFNRARAPQQPSKDTIYSLLICKHNKSRYSNAQYVLIFIESNQIMYWNQRNEA